MKYGAVITAAGMSTRMKEFKQLLKIGETTFAERVITAFREAGIENIVVVTGYRGDELEQSLKKKGVRFIRNNAYRNTDMFKSAAMGLAEAVKTSDRVFICPVDIPFFSNRTVEKMMRSSTDSDVLIPTFNKRRGHPVLLNRKAARFVLQYNGNGGLRKAFEEMEISGNGRISFAEVDEKGICFDADTPDDYKKCLEWGKQERDSMKNIGKAVEKKDHKAKMSGTAEYTADKKFTDLLFGSFVRSKMPHAKIKNVRLPELPNGYYYVSGCDIPENHWSCDNNLPEDPDCVQPIFADKEVKFIGEAILMICGPEIETVRKFCNETIVEYEPLPSVLCLDDAKKALSEITYGKGDVEKAFQEADRIITETFRTGYQEQAYLEPQSASAVFDKENGKLTLYGSMQCPYYVHSAIMNAFGLDKDHVRVVQETTGGGFGGKEDYPSIIGCQTAAAAIKSGHPVRNVLSRREDMTATTKRHPSIIKYDAALDKNGRIIGLKADIRLDAGAYQGLSDYVLQRTVIAACGAYKIDNLIVSGRAMHTNLVSNGAYRGFGAPQIFFAMETFMNHIAEKLNIEPLEYKQMHFVKCGDENSTGGRFRQYVPIAEMIEKAEKISDYSKKRQQYAKQQNSRYRKGIGISVFYHGCGFTGSAEADIIKTKLTLLKHSDDRVEILESNTDIGQGLKTTFSKIAAHVLEIPYEKIIIENPDTDRVPDSGPTVASRSLMICGMLIERAAKRLKKEWIPGKEQEITEHFVSDEEITPWDPVKFHGDSYPAYSWGVNVVEVKEDTLTGNTELLGVWGIYDVGKVIDETIMQGQAQGGMLQGIGYASMEKMQSHNGAIWQNSFTDYMLPTSMDTVKNEIVFIDNPYKGGPFGAKGAGELTLIGAAPAYVSAVEQAAGRNFSEIPLTPERILEEDIL